MELGGASLTAEVVGLACVFFVRRRLDGINFHSANGIGFSCWRRRVRRTAARAGTGFCFGLGFGFEFVTAAHGSSVFLYCC
jgi:hypothetical protein